MFGKKKKQAKLEQEQREKEQHELELAQQQAAQRAEEAAKEEENNGKIYLESEIIDDDEDDNSLPKEYESIAYILKQETGEDLLAQPVDDDVEELPLEEVEPEVAPEVAPEVEPVQEVKEENAPETEAVQEPVAEEAPTEEEPQEVEETEEEVTEETPTEEETTDDEEAQEETAVAPQEPKEEVVYVVDGPSEDDDEIVKPAKLVKLPNLVDYMLSQNMSKQMKINIATLLLSTYNKYKDIPAEKKIIVQCMAKVMRSLIQG